MLKIVLFLMLVTGNLVSSFPEVSIISAINNETSAIQPFLEDIVLQTYFPSAEHILVNDTTSRTAKAIIIDVTKFFEL